MLDSAVDVAYTGRMLAVCDYNGDGNRDFNPTTKIKYSIANKQQIILKVFDILGNEISILVNEEKSAGEHEVEFYGSNLSSGVYYYTLTATDLRGNKQAQTKQMVLIK
jgi:hypothetical protein